MQAILHSKTLSAICKCYNVKKKTFLPNYLLICFPFYFIFSLKIFERANKATKGREKYGSVCFGSIQGEENNNSQTHAV